MATEDGWLSTWDWSNKELRKALESSRIHNGPVYSLTFDVEGRFAASAGWDGQCVKFDVKQPKIDKHSYPANRDPGNPLKFSSVAFHPTTERIAGGGLDGTIRIWQLREPQREPRRLPNHLGGVTRMAFDPHGDYLAASGGDGVIRVWSVQRLRSEEMVLEITDHFEEIIGISFTSDGKFVATASEDGVFLLTGILDGHVVELGSDLLETRN